MDFPRLDRIEGPHRGIELQWGGAAIAGSVDSGATGWVDSGATGALVMIHGRNASAREMLGFSGHLRPGSWAFVAPSAAGGSWFPASFQTPLEENEPELSSALDAVRAILLDLRDAGFKRLAVMGFSQGACLALETVARMGRPADGGPVDGRGGAGQPLVDAAFGLSGALFGPLGIERAYAPLAGRPRVYTSVHEGDAYIPSANVMMSAELLRSLGAETTFVLHPGTSHIIRPADIAVLQAYLDSW